MSEFSLTMLSDHDSNPGGMSRQSARSLMHRYAGAVSYVSVATQSSDEAIGTAFHIGGGVLVTARHVVYERQIIEIGHSRSCASLPDIWYSRHGQGTHSTRRQQVSLIRGPFYHPNPRVDVAALVLPGLERPSIPLGDHLDDWLDDSLTLTEAIVMGYPPVPFAEGPLLITARAEVSAIVDLYGDNPHPRFILSSMARGGFSGGPVISCYDFGLGVITDSLSHNDGPTELGYMTAITVEPILDTLGFNNICPPGLSASWELYGNESPHSQDADGP